MKRILSALVLATFSVVGCGDDEGDTNGDTGAAGESSNLPAGGAPATGNVGCDPAEEGVCQNATDCPFVVDGTARLEAGECGKGCISIQDEDERRTCAVDCLLNAVDMSNECASCYADTVNCSISNCAAKCIANTEAQACKDCQVESGCREEFNTCSGLPE